MSRRTIEFITKEEFCEKIHTEPDCWIFEKCRKPNFWIDREKGREDWYYFDNRIDIIYRFKNDPKGGEILMSKLDRNTGEWFGGGIWSTWTQYD